jgi:predicted nucleic acid-binding protein
MSVNEFVDTNILIYLFDRSAGAKRESAKALVTRLWQQRTGAVSLQVLQEFYATATRRLTMSGAEARTHVRNFGYWATHRPSLADLDAAIELSLTCQVSYWDALVIRSAQQMGCTTLWSEDLASGQSWGSVTVRNPFAF